MGVTLDAGAMAEIQRALQFKNRPLIEHLNAWTNQRISLSTPVVAWAEYWRGRNANTHFIARVRRLIQIDVVSLKTAEMAADALRQWPVSHNRNNVKHLIDAIVMAHADLVGDAVYTADVDDFASLWDHFQNIRAIVSATTGDIVRRR